MRAKTGFVSRAAGSGKTTLGDTERAAQSQERAFSRKKEKRATLEPLI